MVKNIYNRARFKSLSPYLFHLDFKPESHITKLHSGAWTAKILRETLPFWPAAWDRKYL